MRKLLLVIYIIIGYISGIAAVVVGMLAVSQSYEGLIVSQSHWDFVGISILVCTLAASTSYSLWKISNEGKR